MPIHQNVRKCIHTKLNGRQCGSPAVTNKARCFHHEEIVRRRNARKPGQITCAAELQQAITDVISGLLERRMSRIDATAVLYALQLCQNNIKNFAIRSDMEELKDKDSLIQSLLDEADHVYELETEGEIDAHATYYQQKEELMKAGVPYHEWPGNGLPRKGETKS